MQLNLSTNEIDRVRVKLRGDVIVRPLPTVDGVTYQIEDPVAVKYYRVGRAEYVLISLLDGRTSLAEAVSLSARVLGGEAFSEQEATSICLWLLETGLAIPTEGAAIAPAHHRHASIAKFFNPFWMKIPLLRPEQLLDWGLPATRWFFSPAAIIAMLALWVFAVVTITGHIDEFWADSRQVFSSHNWILLAIVWVALKVAHEIGHGLCCRYYGGRVTELGIVFVLFAPMAYVDVTSSLGMQSRWRRMHIAAAGMLVEVTIAAIAALCWAEATTPFMRHLLYNVIITASLTTIVFNINPLMRFDGYFILEDLIDLPNLGATANRWKRSRLSRLFYGEGRSIPLPAGLRGTVIRVYACLSSIWRVVVSGSLLTAAAVMFHGAGLVLAIGAMLAWFIHPLLDLFQSLIQRWRRNRLGVCRAIALGALLTITTGVLIFALPSPFQRQAPGIVDYADLQTVRVASPGFVEIIYVHDGDLVAEGDEPVRLRNDDLASRVTDLTLAIEQSEAKRIGLVNRRELALAQIELRQQQALREQLAEAQGRLDALTIRAPRAGRIVARRIEQQIGNYMKEGTEMLVIGDEARKEIISSVDQRDMEAFTAPSTLSTPLATHLRIRGVGEATSNTRQLEPRASTKLPHPALSAIHGGAVDVVAAEDKTDEGVRLSEPRFLLRVALDPETSRRLFAGQLASASPLAGRRTLAEQLTSSMRDWTRSLVDPE